MVEKLEKFIESAIIQGISHIFDHKTVHFGCPSVLTFLPPFRRHLCEFPAGFGLSAAATATPRVFLEDTTKPFPSSKQNHSPFLRNHGGWDHSRWDSDGTRMGYITTGVSLLVESGINLIPTLF